MHAGHQPWLQRVTRLKAHLRPDDTSPVLERRPCRAEVRDSKVVTAEAAIDLIRDGAIVSVGGFVGIGVPECLLVALRARHDRTDGPSKLTLINVAAGGDSTGRGLNVLAKDGLVAKYIYAWSGLSPTFQKLAKARKLEAWNLPLGVVSHIIRDVAAKRMGPITPVGLATFVDPRETGGKTHPDQEDMVELVQIGGKELLWYKAPAKIDVALIRGTSADMDGNISFEQEPFFADALNQAMAAHNSGGIVIVQVRRLVERGSLPTRAVHIPSCLVTKVVVAPPELHWQSFASPEPDGALSGEVRHPEGSLPPLGMSVRRIIAYRAMLAIEKPQAIINLGVGMPEGMASVVAAHAAKDIPHLLPLTLSTEVGVFGGTPAGGLRFGAAVNATTAVPCSTIIDFYQGGGIDMACLGMAEVDEEGNVNVSRFADRAPGCGGFIDISQNARQVVFVGTFTSGGLQVKIEDSKLQIVQEGRTRKFKRKVFEKTFGGASVCGRSVLYVTERAVFKAHEQGIELVEVAPGIDLDKHVLAHMDFRPIMKDVRRMDPRCFHS